MRLKNRASMAAIVVGLATASTCAGGIAVAATTGGTTVHTCASKKTGAPRVTKKCAKTETTIVLGQTGPQGLVGPRGIQGATGVPGAAGINGVNGSTGPKGDPGSNGPSASVTYLHVDGVTQLGSASDRTVQVGSG